MFINLNKNKKHSFFMNLALLQARKNLGNTGINPSVGCAIVKNDNLISLGSTSIEGRPHAEKNALKSSLIKVRGSDMYITLEPCSHKSKRPTCVESICKNGIRKVFFSINDPDVRSFDKSKLILSKNKIVVTRGISYKILKSFYRSYLKSKTSLLPFVTCKLAISKDYFTVNNKDKWITNFYSRSRGHVIRSQHDCIITSYKTIVKDNSRLTCRINGLIERSPDRVILDKNLKTPIYSNIVRETKKNRTIIFFNNTKNKKKIRLLKKFKIKLIHFPLDYKGEFDLQEVLMKLKEFGFSRILVEAGYNLSLKFLYNNLVDDLKLFVSNLNLYKNGKHNIKKHFRVILKKRKKFYEKVNLCGDKLITYELK